MKQITTDPIKKLYLDTDIANADDIKHNFEVLSSAAYEASQSLATCSNPEQLRQLLSVFFANGILEINRKYDNKIEGNM